MIATSRGSLLSLGHPNQSGFSRSQPSRPRSRTLRHSEAPGPYSTLQKQNPSRSSSQPTTTPPTIRRERHPTPPACTSPPIPQTPRPPSQSLSLPRASSPSGPGFLFSACTHYHAVAPLNLEPILYPSSLQTTYPCLCLPCDFTLRLSEGASIRQLWFDIAVPRYNYLIELGESVIRPQGAPGKSQEDGWMPQARREEYRWLEPVLEDARRIREEQGKIVVRFAAGIIREFTRRWGEGQGERLRRALRNVRSAS